MLDLDLTLDLTYIRSQFPALAQQVNGQPAVFLDAPGGTQVPRRVIEAMTDYLTRSNSNSHGAFETSRRSDEILQQAHAAVADLLGCDAKEVVFGPNMTTLTFATSRAIGREIKRGDEIIVTALDHDANVAPWRALEEQGAVLRVAGIRTEDCTLDTEGLLGLLNERTKIVAVGIASNSVGSINDVAAITKAAHQVGALCYVDAVHYAPHGPIDVREIGCDFLVCSAYKFFGPHVGALYGKAEHLERLRPYKVRPASDEIPDRWETGTLNHEGLAGAAAAVDYLADLGSRFGVKPDEPAVSGKRSEQRQLLLAGMRAMRGYERERTGQLIHGLLSIEGLQFYGIRETSRFDQRVPTVSIRLDGHHPRAIAQHLGDQGIFVWDGNFYALGLTERLDVEATGGMVRIGLATTRRVRSSELSKRCRGLLRQAVRCLLVRASECFASQIATANARAHPVASRFHESEFWRCSPAP